MIAPWTTHPGVVEPGRPVAPPRLFDPVVRQTHRGIAVSSFWMPP